MRKGYRLMKVLIREYIGNEKSFTILQKTKKAFPKGKAFILSEPERIRTSDRLLRREVLYPAELRALVLTSTKHTFNQKKGMK